MCYYL